MPRRFIILMLLSVLSMHIHAQKIIELQDSTQEFILQPDYYSVYEDRSKVLSIKEISLPGFQTKFTENQKLLFYNEHPESAYWIRFRVKKNARFDNNFIIESYSPHTEDFRFYISNGNRSWIEKKSGQSLHFYEREIINKNLIYNLPLDTFAIHTFYIRVQSRNFSSFDFRIKPAKYFAFYNTNEYFFLGIYYGILIIMAIYNLMLFFSIKEDVYIYYVLYVLAGMLSTLTDDCLGYQYVWFKFPQLNTPIGHHIAPSLLLLTFVLYSRKFLDLKNAAPSYDRIIVWSMVAYFIYYLLHVTVLPDNLYFRSIYLIPFIVVYFSGIKSFMQGYKPARFFVFGYTIIFISLVIIQLRASGTISGNLLTVYSLNYGLVLEVAVLSFAMADRIRFIKKEREEALKEKNETQKKIIDQLKINEELKDKVNHELESKVVQRTRELHEKNRELEEANVKLIEMTDRANQMSLKLDLDNWNLQKNIKESIKARMSGTEVSYSEFNKIFPDEITCLRYLDELKWDNVFKCRKCSNTKYIAGIKVFSRKCT